MIAEALDISRETYFAILLDRSYDGPVMWVIKFKIYYNLSSKNPSNQN